eukprot:11207629-Lingulodinium_polyedra.AAC.1
MEAAMRAVRGLAQPGRRVAVNDVLDAAKNMGLRRNVSSRVLENWTAIGAWRPRGSILEFADETQKRE